MNTTEELQLKRISNPTDADYAYVKKILIDSFPSEEYRDLNDWAAYTQNRPEFCNHVILDGTTRIGLLSYWNFETFYYVEHFAIDSQYRNYKYGSRVLALILETLDKAIVLEVEKPVTELAQRRISFYERNEFVLSEYEYQQPPYRKGEEWLPMCLMIHYKEPNFCDLAQVKDVLYKLVYGINNQKQLVFE